MPIRLLGHTGTRKGTRTPNPQIRNLLHYPVVLYGHKMPFAFSLASGLMLLPMARRGAVFISRSLRKGYPLFGVSGGS